MSSFRINKVNPFPVLRAPFPPIFLSNIFIAFEAKVHANPGKLFLAKGIPRSAIAFLPKLPNNYRRNPPDSII